MRVESGASRTPGLVLVVDDIEGNRILARAYLERIGWQVDEAGGGLEAMEYLKHRIPQAMLIDIRMPDVSGDQLAAFVRSQIAAVASAPGRLHGALRRRRHQALQGCRFRRGADQAGADGQHVTGAARSAASGLTNDYLVLQQGARPNA